MLLTAPHKPLQLVTLPIPQPCKNEVLIAVEACGVCRTDLHIVDGELPHSALPLILGHQVVGTIVSFGEGCQRKLALGQRVGVPWLGKSCGVCDYCARQEENLCEKATYTGYTHNGGFAEYCTAHEDFLFPIPGDYSPAHAAPLLCAGLIGYRALRFAGEAKKIGFYGFGAAAHILIQVAHLQGRQVFAFTRPGDAQAQIFAKQLGSVWAGGSDELSPTPLDAAIIFAPVGTLIPQALKAVRKGGSVISAGIHMSDIPSFPYALLYGERVVRSVTNLKREDGELFFSLVGKAHPRIDTTVHTYPLEEANSALADLREGKFTGSAVLLVSKTARSEAA